jgi:hypothetical protein
VDPTLQDLAWAAGFMEGEGTFTRYLSHDKYPSVRISASQKNKEPLEKLQKFFGGNILPKKCKKIWWEKQRRYIYSSESWTWRIYGVMARNTTKLMYPWLSERRKNQAKEVLDYSYTNPNPSTKGPRRGRFAP